MGKFSAKEDRNSKNSVIYLATGSEGNCDQFNNNNNENNNFSKSI